MAEVASSQIFYFTLFVPSLFLKQWYLALECSPFQDYSNNKHQFHSKETTTCCYSEGSQKEDQESLDVEIIQEQWWVWTKIKLTRSEYLFPLQKGKVCRYILTKLSQVKEQYRWTKCKSRSWCKRWKVFGWKSLTEESKTTKEISTCM